MMSDSGLQIEADNETVQPDEVVATESEATEAAPLAEDTETEEFEVTIAADQQNEGEDGKEIDYRAMALAKAEKASSVIPNVFRFLYPLLFGIIFSLFEF